MPEEKIIEQETRWSVQRGSGGEWWPVSSCQNEAVERASLAHYRERYPENSYRLIKKTCTSVEIL